MSVLRSAQPVLLGVCLFGLILGTTGCADNTRDLAVELKLTSDPPPLPPLAAPPPIPHAVYHVGPGDVLRVRIFELEQMQEEADLELEVLTSGEMVLPHVGPVKVAGQTADQIRRLLVDTLKEGFIKDPKVLVSVAEYRSHPVRVIGSVNSPGVVYLERDTTTLLEALSAAGGPTDSASMRVRLYRPEPGGGPGGAVEDVDLFRLVRDGRWDQDLVVEPGTTILVLQAGTYYVSGYVASPGAFPLRGNVTFLQALAQAGGIDKGYVASASETVVKRMLPDGETVFIPVDVWEVLDGEMLDFALQPGDHVYVPQTDLRAIVIEIWEFLKARIGGGINFGTVTVQ